MAKIHKCPICGVQTENDQYRPFCSKRCADIDLGRWFNGSYNIPAVELDEAEYEELEKEISRTAENQE